MRSAVNRSRKRQLRTARRRRAFDLGQYIVALMVVAVALGVGEAIQPWLGIENVDLVFLTAVVACGSLRIVAIAGCERCGIAVLQFFLPAAIYTFTITDPTNVVAFFSSSSWRLIVSNVAARVRTQAVAAVSRARHHRVALRIQPQACRRWRARRRALGDRVPGGVDAQGSRRYAAAGERCDCRQGRLPAGGYPW